MVLTFTQLFKDLGLEGYRKIPTLSVAGGRRSGKLDALITQGQVTS